MDYQALTGTAKLKAGKTSKKVPVVPEGDLGGAAKKTVVLTLQPGTGYTVGTADKSRSRSPRVHDDVLKSGRRGLGPWAESGAASCTFQLRARHVLACRACVGGPNAGNTRSPGIVGVIFSFKLLVLSDLNTHAVGFSRSSLWVYREKMHDPPFDGKASPTLGVYCPDETVCWQFCWQLPRLESARQGRTSRWRGQKLRGTVSGRAIPPRINSCQLACIEGDPREACL